MTPNGNTFSTSNSIKGLGGGQVGVNYEFYNGVVVGAEAMFDWRFNNNNTMHHRRLWPGGTFRAAAASITVNNQWLTTATGKLGYAWDRVHGLRQGRWRLGGIEQSYDSLRRLAPLIQSLSNSNWGWTVGAGAEYAFFGGWSARIEYDYIGLTNQTFTVPAGHGWLHRGRSIHLQQPQHPDGHRRHQLQVRRLGLVISRSHSASEAIGENPGSLPGVFVCG